MYYKLSGLDEINQTLLAPKTKIERKNNYVMTILLFFIITISVVSLFVLK